MVRNQFLVIETILLCPTTLMFVPLHIGGSGDHTPLGRQFITDDPIKSYPLAQEYVTCWPLCMFEERSTCGAGPQFPPTIK